jgi:hypothetical protein
MQRVWDQLPAGTQTGIDDLPLQGFAAFFAKLHVSGFRRLTLDFDTKTHSR